MRAPPSSESLDSVVPGDPVLLYEQQNHQAHRFTMEATGTVPLPFENRMLVPFIMAWRTVSAALPPAMHAARVSEILKEWGYELSAERITAIAEDYAEILRLSRTPTPPPLQSRQLVPTDQACCVCDGELKAFIHGSRTLTAIPGRSRVTLWSLSDAPQPCDLVDKECVDCGTLHAFNSVTTARCVAVIRVPNPTKDSKKPKTAVYVRSALRSELGISTRYAKARPGASVLSLMRGSSLKPKNTNIPR